MNAPLWRPPGFGGPQYLYTIYIYSELCHIFHQAFIAQLIECLISDQKAMSLNLTAANEPLSKICINFFIN